VAVHRGNRWTSAEDDQLRQLIAEKKSITVISAKLKRSSEAVRMRMFKLRISVDQPGCGKLRVENKLAFLNVRRPLCALPERTVLNMSCRPKGTIREVATYICALCERGFGRFENARGRKCLSVAT
jgi:hypothetical protein